MYRTTRSVSFSLFSIFEHKNVVYCDPTVYLWVHEHNFLQKHLNRFLNRPSRPILGSFILEHTYTKQTWMLTDKHATINSL